MFNKILSKIKDSLKSDESITIEQYLKEAECRNSLRSLKKPNNVDAERYPKNLNGYMFKEQKSIHSSSSDNFYISDFDNVFVDELVKNAMAVEEEKRNLQSELKNINKSKKEKALSKDIEIFLECMEVLRESDEKLAESLKEPELKVETFSNMDFEELLNQDYPLEYVDRSNVQFLLKNMNNYIKEKERQEPFSKKQKQSFVLICKVYKLDNGSLKKGVKVDF
tara:strand:+ start:18050 stop:18718 length:669 start_codon:yes stop_codon:yes gene_type:complete